MTDSFLLFLTGGLIVIGMVGTLVPILPGLLLVWGACVFWGFVTGFDALAVAALVVITGLLGIGMYLGLRIPQRSAAGEGLGPMAIILGLGLALVLAFVIPVAGVPIGFIAGVFLARLRQTRDAGRAWRSALVTIGALLRASAAQFGVSVAMGLVWLGWVALG